MKILQKMFWIFSYDVSGTNDADDNTNEKHDSVLIKTFYRLTLHHCISKN